MSAYPVTQELQHAISGAARLLAELPLTETAKPVRQMLEDHLRALLRVQMQIVKRALGEGQ
ncbi:hypothetical protein [Pseudomonas sp. RIT-PI-AD]|uniref:hypothetical protein n=1 Tax=Pseudomonas sp. RIT-PI-AD TaxID=3035294 RepID=UPI0021DA954A|nr:hypothetical protein [Pseudomonas sp. RIT-PI-AD]